jgi:hypothetical protein
MAEPGDVLLIQDFEFSDGSKGDKWVVVMHAGAGEVPYLVVKTTSQARRYAGLSPGCSEKRRVFVVPQGSDKFPKDTYVQLDEIFPFDALEMLRGHWSQRMKPLFSMTTQRFNELRNCLKRLRQDIPVRYYEWMFGK